MKELLDKISSYNLFNYLFPGVLFVIISKEFTKYNFIQQNEILGVFLYYFIGMIISRVGSLVIEPILKKTSFLKFSDYKNFISASKKDEKIELFSEINNTYRTITAMIFLLVILKGYNYLETILNIPKSTTSLIGITLLLIMFLFSYSKQTNYISKRIDAANK
jgi:hypothetical protein